MNDYTVTWQVKGFPKREILGLSLNVAKRCFDSLIKIGAKDFNHASIMKGDFVVQSIC